MLPVLQNPGERPDHAKDHGPLPHPYFQAKDHGLLHTYFHITKQKGLTPTSIFILFAVSCFPSLNFSDLVLRYEVCSMCGKLHLPRA